MVQHGKLRQPRKAEALARGRFLIPRASDPSDAKASADHRLRPNYSLSSLAALPKFSLSGQPVPVGKDLAPAQDPDRFPKASRPERVGSIELLNGLEAVGLYEPEATRGSAG